jgi:hypothetical protein
MCPPMGGRTRRCAPTIAFLTSMRATWYQAGKGPVFRPQPFGENGPHIVHVRAKHPPFLDAGGNLGKVFRSFDRTIMAPGHMVGHESEPQTRALRRKEIRWVQYQGLFRV